MRPSLFFTWLLLCLATLAIPARAQITVDLSMKRHLFIAHEPVLATVTVTNLSGRDITLADTPEMQWFAFQITGTGERIFPPRNPNYALDPLEIKAGAQMTRTVNLSELYEIGDYGTYRVRASIFFAELNKFFSSRNTSIEVTEGQLLWTQTVGTPGGTAQDATLRKFSLLSHQQGEFRVLYVRVEDRDNSTVYCTQELGRLLEGQPPVEEFDLGNNLYILQLTGQREYLLSKIGLNGEYLGGTRYTAPKSRPYFRRLADGQLQIVGAKRETVIAKGGPGSEAPAKLSARPAGLPSELTAAPAAPAR
jgi:hypothetical protein